MANIFEGAAIIQVGETKIDNLGTRQNSYFYANGCNAGVNH